MKIRVFTLIMTIGIYLLIYACNQNKTNVKVEAPLFENMGGDHFEITTSSELAQRYFDQGLVLAYGLNHAEALRSFEEAIRLDSECAMCNWGIAYILGPNINSKMDETLLNQANSAVQKAVSLIDKVSAKEKAMIWAMTKRYPELPIDDMSAHNSEYARALGKIYEEYSKNDDIGCLYAEALMNEHPWNFWKKNGEPESWTPKILTILEGILEYSPYHSGANHYYIHAVEASTNPSRALPSANRLRDLVPDAGHLVHMPSHIYIRTGDYHQGTIANEKAVKADSTYIENCKAQGIYPLAYFPHNYHFMAATAALEGRGEKAIDAAFKVAAHVDQKLMREPGWGTLQHYYTIPYFVLVKFAQWEKIVQLPKPEEDLKYPLAIWHYAQGMAALSADNLDNGKQHLTSINEIEADSSIYEIEIWELNSVGSVVNMAALILEGEIETKMQHYDEAIEKLNQALAIEESLTYTEPPDWFFSIRHALGAIYMEAGKYNEAESTYKEDLKMFPDLSLIHI